MNNTKLITGLKGLKPDEWRSLIKYVSMDHSSKSDHHILLTLLREEIKNKESLSIKEDFRKEHFSSMTTKSFLNLCSRAFMSFEEWLVWYEFKKDKDKCDVLLVKTYNRRGIFSLADKTYTRVHTRLRNEKQMTLDTNKNLMDLYHYHHFSENPAKYRLGGRLLEDLVKSFFYSINEIGYIYLLEMKTWGKLIKHDYLVTFRILEECLESMPINPTVELTRKLYDILNENNELLLPEILFSLQNSQIKPGSDLEVFATLYGIAHSMRQWYSKGSDDFNAVMNFHDYGLKSEILTNLGNIRCGLFLVIVSLLVHTQSVEDCRAFVDKWIILIEDEDKESARDLCLSYIRLKEEKYDEIVLTLKSRRYNVLNNELQALAFELTALYKSKEWDIFDYRLTSYKRKLRNIKGKLITPWVNSYNNYVKVLKLLMLNEFEKDIRIELSDYKEMFNKTWLTNEVKSKGLM